MGKGTISDHTLDFPKTTPLGGCLRGFLPLRPGRDTPTLITPIWGRVGRAYTPPFGDYTHERGCSVNPSHPAGWENPVRGQSKYTQ